MTSDANSIFIVFIDESILLDYKDIRIDGFQNKFCDVPNEYLVVCLIKDENDRKGIAVMRGETVNKINKTSKNKSNNIRFFVVDEDEDEDDKFAPKLIPTEKSIRPVNTSSMGDSSAPRKKIEKNIKKFPINRNFGINFDSVSIVKTISSGKNGVVVKITGEDENQSIILKSSIYTTKYYPDNLLYEFLVGQYINTKAKVFSCFIQTFNIYNFLDYNGWLNFNYGSDQKEKIEILKTRLKKEEFNSLKELLGFACRNAKYLALSIENIKNSKNLSDMLENQNFVENDLLNVLYQIYMPLSVMAKNFTHYDLHAENVMIEKEAENCCIEYEYVYKDGSSVKFKSQYKAKIIDYGRCFFLESDNPSQYGSSKIIKEVLCSINVPECKTPSWIPPSFYYTLWSTISISNIASLFTPVTRCGEAFGFARIFNDNIIKKFNGADNSNMSQDLLLLYDVYTLIKAYHKELSEVVLDFFSKRTQFQEKEKIINEQAQIKEVTYVSDTMKDDTPIQNVNDAHNALKKYVLDNISSNQEIYQDFTSISRLTIYESGQNMEEYKLI